MPLQALALISRRRALGILAAIALCVTTWPAFPVQAAKARLEDYEVGSYKMGGDFALTNQDGKTTGLRDFRGKVVVMFFGYTFCPDVCPLTLGEMGRLAKALGSNAGRMQPVFVTLDPARDTAPRLKSYLANFEPGIVGLTGTERDITHVAKLYRARFAKRGAGGDTGYLLDHTAFIYLVDTKGAVRYLMPHDAGTELLAEGVRQLLKN
jgi:protein SCO1/2